MSDHYIVHPETNVILYDNCSWKKKDIKAYYLNNEYIILNCNGEHQEIVTEFPFFFFFLTVVIFRNWDWGCGREGHGCELKSIL